MARHIAHVTDHISPSEEEDDHRATFSSSSSSSAATATTGTTAATPIVILEDEHKSSGGGSELPERKAEKQQQIQQFWNGLTGKSTLELALEMRHTAGGWQQLDKLTPGAGLGEEPFELGQMVRVPKDIPLVSHPGELILAMVLQTLKSKKLKVRDRLGYVRIVKRSEVRTL